MAGYLILGNTGSDAGYWVFRNGHLEHVGGWSVDSIREVQAGIGVLKAATRLRTPGLAEAVAGLIEKAIGSDLAEHVGEEHTVVIA